MKAYIDKTALVAELNRLTAELVEEGEDTMFEQGRISAFEDVKVFINHTLEVKEIGVDLGDPQGDIGVKWVQEEPVSDDLEEAAHLYVDTTIEYFDSEGNPCCYLAFKAGAQWQKEQMIDKACEWLENWNAYRVCVEGQKDWFIKQFKKAMEE